MSEEQIKDMIEPIPNWEYTYRYDSSRTCGKTYFQSLLDEKQQKIDKAIEWVKKNQYYFPKPTELLEILGDKE